MEASSDRYQRMEVVTEKEKEKEDKKKVELIHLAIQQLIEEKKNSDKKTTTKTVLSADDHDHDDDEDEDHLLLSRLLSQVELLKEDNNSKLPNELLAETKEPPSSGDDVKVEKKDEKEMGTEEIVKELRKLKRQNTVTHWLLSVMIFLTVAWQLSEVSLILTVKDTLRNPFKSVGDLIKGAINGSGAKIGERNNNEIDCAAAAAAAKSSLSNCCSQLETPSLPPLKIPDFPRMDLPVLGLNNGGGPDED
ncbi:hypothetical protein BVC80_1837g303 [Macleaya cordata]|uniref:Uncharacterized protein n=1 Tax=Macleaya cordata TaxID=56857 RepID=A0A200R464_MACCD|nr:hypothetical protein BVC80_1837g303 [Macleaya cordata]